MFSAEHESIDHIENLQVHDCLQPTAGDHLCRRLLGHWASSHNLSLNNHYLLLLFLSVFNQICYILKTSATTTAVHSNTRPIKAKYTKYGIWGVYLSVLNMVEWGIPEKILQNAVQSP